jgi:hypothetical protein
MAAFGLMLRIVTKMEQRIQALIGFEPNVTTYAPVTARGPTPGHELLAPKGCDTVSTVSGFDFYFCSIYEHVSILHNLEGRT